MPHEPPIDPENGFPIPRRDEVRQYRRAEKGWRYRDHERTWTQYIWGMLATSQSIMLGIFAIIATRPEEPVSKYLLLIVASITLVELAIFIWRAHARRAVDRLWAAHYEDLVRHAEIEKGYDDATRNNECMVAESGFADTIKHFEWVAFGMFSITICILLYVICQPTG